MYIMENDRASIITHIINLIKIKCLQGKDHARNYIELHAEKSN